MNTIIILTIMIQPGVWKDYIIYHKTHELCHKSEKILSLASSVKIKLERIMIKEIFDNGGKAGMIWVGCHL